MQDIEKLALVLMDALDLHVEERGRIDGNVVDATQPDRELLLALLFHGLPALTE